MNSGHPGLSSVPAQSGQAAVSTAKAPCICPAAFAHGAVLKNERPRLFAMARRARFIPARHGQPARRFENVRPVRIMAIGSS
jgi:hypothetical protein